MLESIYFLLIVLAFIMIPTSFFVGKGTETGPNTFKFGQQVILLAISAILFGALAAASFNVEIVTCTATNCIKDSFVFEDNAVIFGFFALIAGVLTLVKSFDAFYFTKGKL